MDASLITLNTGNIKGPYCCLPVVRTFLFSVPKYFGSHVTLESQGGKSLFPAALPTVWRKPTSCTCTDKQGWLHLMAQCQPNWDSLMFHDFSGSSFSTICEMLLTHDTPRNACVGSMVLPTFSQLCFGERADSVKLISIKQCSSVWLCRNHIKGIRWEVSEWLQRYSDNCTIFWRNVTNDVIEG